MSDDACSGPSRALLFSQTFYSCLLYQHSAAGKPVHGLAPVIAFENDSCPRDNDARCGCKKLQLFSNIARGGLMVSVREPRLGWPMLLTARRYNQRPQRNNAMVDKNTTHYFGEEFWHS